MSNWGWYGVKLLYESTVSGQAGAGQTGSSGEGTPKSGTEVYSRWIRVPNTVEADEFVRRFYPEADGEEDEEP